MASFEVVNYSLRPGKTIQRQIIFDGVRALQQHLELKHLIYVGFGSIWFTDFVLAHKLLGVDDMFSIESDDIGYCRAKFNSPYATVRVYHGLSSAVLSTLYNDDLVRRRPWMVWLDYDYEFDETVRDDVRSLIENVPANSIVLITFNGKDAKYGDASDRPRRIRHVFGDVAPDDLLKDQCREGRMQETLANLALDFMKSMAAELRRPGGFVPAFRIIYKDTTPMVTVGGILPTKGAVKIAMDAVSAPNWCCFPEKPVVAPHLTLREAVTLQSQLPRTEKLSRDIVKSLGFDLEEEQIEAFQRYYRMYPAFAQIVA